MTRTPWREEIEALYASIPSVDCKGLCFDSCGPIVPALAEEDLLREKGIRPPHPRFDLQCSKLTGDRRCSIHPDRPAICRLYGVIKGYEDVMACQFGCVPERWLTQQESDAILERLWAMEGDSGDRIGGAMRAMVGNAGLDPLHRGMAAHYLRRTTERNLVRRLGVLMKKKGED
jgi:Fe-S-cluster containining protein